MSLTRAGVRHAASIALALLVAAGALGPWASGTFRPDHARPSHPAQAFADHGLEGLWGYVLVAAGLLTAALIVLVAPAARARVALWGGGFAALVSTGVLLNAGSPHVVDLRRHVEVHYEWGLMLSLAAALACAVLGLAEHRRARPRAGARGQR